MANPAIERREAQDDALVFPPGRTVLRLKTDTPSPVWTFVGTEAPLPASGAVVVPLSRLEAITAHTGLRGVRLMPADDPRVLAPYVDQLALIELAFPRYRDGRPYSSARILREQLGFKGEIRAIGDVLLDQLRFMRRCGVDAWELHPSASPEAAAQMLARDIPVYQAAADAQVPVWKARQWIS